MKDKYSAFALIEVVIVIVLISGSFLVFLEALNQAKSMQVRSEIVSIQSMLLHQKINEIRRDGFVNTLGFINYTPFPGNSSYKYSINSYYVNHELEPVSNSETDYKKVEISVKHNEADFKPISDSFIITEK